MPLTNEGFQHDRCLIPGGSPVISSAAGLFLKLNRGQHPGLAFEELLSQNLDALYRTALRLCRGEDADAEDLLQDAMLRAFEHHHELKNAGAGRAWLFTILARTHLNRLRTARRRAETLEVDIDEADFEGALTAWQPMVLPDEAAVRSDLRERLREAMDHLEPGLRTAVWLVDVEGFSQREVAGMMEVPEGTVASRLFRARRQLRTILESDGEHIIGRGNQS